MKKSFKIAISIAMVITMSIGLYSMGAADSVSIPLLPYGTTSPGSSNGMSLGTRSGSTYWANANSDDVYVFYAVDRPIAASPSSGRMARFNNGQGANGSRNLDSYDSATSLYYNSISLANGNAITGLNTSIPVYSSIDAGLVAVAESLNPIVVSELNFDLPCGNVAYIAVPAGAVTVTLKESMPFLSAIVGSSWVEINQTRGVTSNMPSIGDIIAVDSLTRIPWMIDASGDKNWLGQSYSAIYTYTHSGGGYLVIYNPSVYAESNTAGSVSVAENNSITVSVSSASYLRVYSSDDDGTIFGTTAVIGNWTSKSSDDNFDTWTDSEGGNAPPSVGGDNVLPSELGIKGILTQLVEDIKSIFEVAWRPIQEILQTVGGFFEKLAELWSWLPSEVSSLLIAGLTVIVAVGVLKSFL